MSLFSNNRASVTVRHEVHSWVGQLPLLLKMKELLAAFGDVAALEAKLDESEDRLNLTIEAFQEALKESTVNKNYEASWRLRGVIEQFIDSVEAFKEHEKKEKADKAALATSRQTPAIMDIVGHEVPSGQVDFTTITKNWRDAVAPEKTDSVIAGGNEADDATLDQGIDDEGGEDKPQTF